MMTIPRPCQRTLVVVTLIIFVNFLVFLISPNSPERVRERFRRKHLMENYDSPEVTSDVNDDESTETTNTEEHMISDEQSNTVQI